jgi:hypothetical protein
MVSYRGLKMSILENTVDTRVVSAESEQFEAQHILFVIFVS